MKINEKVEDTLGLIVVILMTVSLIIGCIFIIHVSHIQYQQNIATAKNLATKYLDQAEHRGYIDEASVVEFKEKLHDMGFRVINVETNIKPAIKGERVFLEFTVSNGNLAKPDTEFLAVPVQ